MTTLSSGLLQKHTPHFTLCSVSFLRSGISLCYPSTTLNNLHCVLTFCVSSSVFFCSSLQCLFQVSSPCGPYHYSTSEVCAISRFHPTISCESRNNVIITIYPRTVPLPKILNCHYHLHPLLSIKIPVYFIILCLSLLP